ncbi:hypothetical protein QNM97_05830 [Gordonia sp. L191]|uniref:hypothetical protein n=1 Tax=Gordonia sp. L191 TaxID=2982699 RepID=UPI0024C0452F|nr:hypothetical protein [Gordonia sp. L191]WHU48518.1 hypothetical protein QNM97_05830 [Gordonia sp. L191]
MDLLVPGLIILVVVIGLIIKIRRDRPHPDGEYYSYPGWATGSDSGSGDSGSSSD